MRFRSDVAALPKRFAVVSRRCAGWSSARRAARRRDLVSKHLTAVVVANEAVLAAARPPCGSASPLDERNGRRIARRSRRTRAAETKTSRYSSRISRFLVRGGSNVRRGQFVKRGLKAGSRVNAACADKSAGARVRAAWRGQSARARVHAAWRGWGGRLQLVSRPRSLFLVGSEISQIYSGAD